MVATASPVPSLRSWMRLLQQGRQQRQCLRCLSTGREPAKTQQLPPPSIPPVPLRSPYRILHDNPYERLKKIKTYPPPTSAINKHPFPLRDHNEAHIQTLDPTGTRTRLFDRSNPDCPQPGDILLATFKTGDPFAGVCLSIRRRGVDTAVLLRNKLLLTGVEMWVKIYSPNVRGMEVVKRAERRARRARLYYLRKPKHDRGSVESEVEQYLKRRRLIRSGALGVGDPKASAKRPESGRVGVGSR
ncbi:MAG: hypothetical protein Q9163_005479 [Psora crenata]